MILRPPAPMVPGSPIPLPEWLFPIDPKSLEKNPKPVKLDDVELLEIPDSKEKFTQARINDPFNAPDWRPRSLADARRGGASGRKPAIMACAYCHTPTGQGRPENSALAGLPEAYIKEQLHDLPQWRAQTVRARGISAERRTCSRSPGR